jgi:hypothetical protein
MPTERQLDIILESQFEFYGCAWQPKASFESNAQSHGLTSEKRTDTPMVPRISMESTSGEVLGKVSYDAENNDFRITPAT